MENLGGWDHSEDRPDFDPNLLNNVDSWGVDPHTIDTNDHMNADVNVNMNVNATVADHQHHHHNHHNHHNHHHGGRKSRSHSKKKRNGSWGNPDQWSNLGVTEFDHESKPDDGTINNSISISINNSMHLQSSSSAIAAETVEAAVEAAVAAISETSDSVTTSTSGDRSGGSSHENNNAQHYQHHNNNVSHLHPLGIQSSASCPAPALGTGATVTPATFFQQQQHSHYQPQQHHGHHGLCSVDLSQALERSVAAPSAVLTTATATATPTTFTNTSDSTQHISSLAANFMLAQAGDSSVAEAVAAAAAAAAAISSVVGPAAAVPTGPTTPQQQQQQQQQHGASVVTQNSIPSSSVSKSKGKSNSNNKTTTKKARGRGQSSRSSTSKTKKKKTNGASSSSSLPPFYLFDAPIELRANFMQNQRRLGLPIQHDPNSYHYGETVNGFHPQQYQLPLGANDGTCANGAGSPNEIPPAPPRNPNAPRPQLIDARHGNHRKNKGGQVKNEREQKRAQKITELIEQLRLQMEDGGWQVEARSKFHTLSNCAEYIKHMIKLTSDKENVNEKLNSDLDEKRRSIEREKEEKAIQEGRSDPESVTSSLTTDTTMSTSRHKQEEETSVESGVDTNDNKKRKLSDSREEGSSSDDANNSNKRHMVSSEETTEESSGDDREGGSGTGSGSGNSGTGSGSAGSGSGGPSAQGCSISKTISTVSELTDNNSGSGDGSSDDVPTEQDSRESTSVMNVEDGIDQPSTSSISSDAAVATEKTSRDHHIGHKDVVFNNDKRMSRKIPPEEVTSLERSFELNYEEVFDKSNIPQLIASTSGKIVTYNECFIKATGYRRSEIERMTIFSLVKPDKLANFFEIVAAALRPDDEETEEKKDDNNNDDPAKIATEESSSTNTNSTEEDKESKESTQSASSEESTKPEEGTEWKGNVSGDSTEETCSNSTEERTNNISADNSVNSSEETSANTSSGVTVKEDEKDKEEEKSASEIADESMPKHLLDYTAMTLPCVDFPAMKKRNQAAADSNSVTIPALHVTVTLMTDKDPRKRCFHCVFTNSKGTNGSLGIITPELLESLYSKPLRSSRRKRKHYSSHQHQRNRARGGTTRVGQSVDTSTNNNDEHEHEQKHCVEHTLSTNEQHEESPSSLLIPPPHSEVDNTLKATKSEEGGDDLGMEIE